MGCFGGRNAFLRCIFLGMGGGHGREGLRACMRMVCGEVIDRILS